MAIQWTPDLAVGVPELDQQHQGLFKTLSDLVDAMQQARGRAEIREVIAYLEKYGVEHFSLEETWMADTQYPGLAAHKAQHQSFVRDVAAMRAEFDAQGVTTALVIDTSTKLSHWLRDHIAKVDKEMAKHIIMVRRRTKT